MFRLSSAPLDPAALARSLDDPRAGALATFEGRVRNHNEGQPVLALDYEAYAALAEKEGTRILEEARAKFAILHAVCVHRIGALAIGDLAVWIGAAAAHRDAAFAACRYIIDETKARVPVWKKEHYATGASAWINCATRPPADGASTTPSAPPAPPAP
ncbi:molybdenum cofactor biosynthesis protein MoaE [Horticoccus luteus]|uniref:Molybdopterin synthase catalytic subunit n=1 Tax=Horticoccus luteus TaxID=2862869 RepID=A0A8F9TVK0_9BACT|nr:molybdenum cofactor biosynthesis protein MoaE [Horticoccus luteus]QYM79093.1 molybdenum cofactor biosynthesis protein MoaE [Horticoccus luteus]